MSNNQAPEGLLRLPSIIGNPKKNIPPLVPVARSTWWQWVKKGIAPKPIHIGPRAVAWDSRAIREFMASGFMANR